MLKMRMSGAKTAVAAVATLTIALVSLPAPSVARTDCEGVQPRGRGWDSITVPPFPPDDERPAATFSTVSELGVDPGNPDTILISNQQTVFLSADGGCSWRQVFDVPATPTADRPIAWPLVVHRIEMVRPSAPGGHIYLLIAAVAAFYHPGPTFIARSDDFGQTWTVLPGPPLTNPDIAVAPNDPNLVYLLGEAGSALTFATTTSPTLSIFASTDAGQSWELRSELTNRTRAGTPADYNWDLAIDPGNKDRLWLKGGYRPDITDVFNSASGANVFSSQNGGRSFVDHPVRIQGSANPRAGSSMAVFDGRGTSGSAPVAGCGGIIHLWTGDWQELPLDAMGSCYDLAFGPRLGRFLALSGDEENPGVFRIDSDRGLITEISPPHDPDVRYGWVVKASGESRPVYYFNAFGHLDRYSGRV